jgi:hypothetical protein
MLGLMTLMPGISFARDRSRDSMVICRMWEYNERFGKSINGVEKNIYTTYTFTTERRNPLLYLVPTMYSIARGERRFIGEIYGKQSFRTLSDYDLQRQVYCGTIPHHRRVMPSLFELQTPNLYGSELYPDRLLSPFNRTNRFFYKYRVTYWGDKAYVSFRPRSANTQLVTGQAYIDLFTGRIISVAFKGNYDMVKFNVNVSMDDDVNYGTIPVRSMTEASFNFIGNRIKSKIESYHNCQTTLPDSINDCENLEMMEQLRPMKLSAEDQAIYDKQRQEEEEAQNDTTPRKSHKIRDFAWNVVGDHLVNSTRAGANEDYVEISPLFNPLYMGYSQSKGISYKLNIGIRHSWNEHRYLTIEPSFGYAFKLKQFYYTVPVRMTYNPKRNGYAEVTVGNGNRISNSALNDDFHKRMPDSIAMPEFKDLYVLAVNHIAISDWLETTVGVMYHNRTSMNRQLMIDAGMQDVYRSFAPLFTVHLKPWKKGPLLTANYERSIKNILKSDLSYERWEFDAVYKHQAKSVRILNLRAGAGFYTSRSTDYFVDFANFHDNNLPTGWEDDWTGQFQLLNSNWYNESTYYLRGHASYDSPLLMLSWIPLVGRAIETERIYLSALSIQHTRPYFELGYGFQNRFFSTAFFASFLGCKYKEFGCKFTIELFRRW